MDYEGNIINCTLVFYKSLSVADDSWSETDCTSAKCQSRPCHSFNSTSIIYIEHIEVTAFCRAESICLMEKKRISRLIKLKKVNKQFELIKVFMKTSSNTFISESIMF